MLMQSLRLNDVESFGQYLRMNTDVFEVFNLFGIFPPNSIWIFNYLNIFLTISAIATSKRIQNPKAMSIT